MTLEVPAIAWDVTPVEVLAAAAMFFLGYVTHEAMHIGALVALREPFTVELLPDGWRGFFVGTGVDVQLQSYPARWRMAVVALAPIVAAAPPFMAWAVALAYPVLDVGVALVLFAWFAAAIPGVHDIVTVATYDPAEAVPAEVSA